MKVNFLALILLFAPSSLYSMPDNQSEQLYPVRGHYVQALYDSAYKGDVYDVSAWIQFGAEVKYLDQDGNSIMHFACHSGKIEMVKVLFHAFPYFRNYPNKAGVTPIHCAIASGDVTLVRYLLKKESFYHYTKLNIRALQKFASNLRLQALPQQTDWLDQLDESYQRKTERYKAFRKIEKIVFQAFADQKAIKNLTRLSHNSNQITSRSRS